MSYMSPIFHAALINMHIYMPLLIELHPIASYRFKDSHLGDLGTPK